MLAFKYYKIYIRMLITNHIRLYSSGSYIFTQSLFAIQNTSTDNNVTTIHVLMKVIKFIHATV